MLGRRVIYSGLRGGIAYSIKQARPIWGAQRRYFIKDALKGLTNAVADLVPKESKKKKEAGSMEDQMMNEIVDKLVGKRNPIGSFVLKSGLKILGGVVKQAITKSGQDIEHIFNTANALILSNSALFGGADVRLGAVTSFNSANINGRATTTIGCQVMSSNPAINNGVATIRATKVEKVLKIESLLVQTYAGDIVDVPVGDSEAVAARSKPIIIDVEAEVKN